MFRLGPGIRGKFLIPLSLVIPVYAMGYITYCRWRHQCQDNQIYVFHLTSFNQRKIHQHQSNEYNQEHKEVVTTKLNTQTHNKIMFEMKT